VGTCASGISGGGCRFERRRQAEGELCSSRCCQQEELAFATNVGTLWSVGCLGLPNGGMGLIVSKVSQERTGLIKAFWIFGRIGLLPSAPNLLGESKVLCPGGHELDVYV